MPPYAVFAWASQSVVATTASSEEAEQLAATERLLTAAEVDIIPLPN